MQALTFKKYKGAAIEEILIPLATLRITVFKDFPYLYEGNLAYEKKYLKTYIAAKNAFVFAVFDGDHLVGASTCIPLQDETQEVQEAFKATGIDVSKQCYFGESILLQAYRGLGLGKLFFKEREAHAQSLADLEACYFCAVERPLNHPYRPKNYVPLDTFWQQQGYVKQNDMSSEFTWLDKGEREETKKRMIYWKKTWL